MDKTLREVMVPGNLLPSEHRGEGRFHGVVTCVKRSSTAMEAFISLSDIRNVRIKLPWDEAQLFLLDAPSGSHWTRQKKARSKRKPGAWQTLPLSIPSAAKSTSHSRTGAQSSTCIKTRAAAKNQQPQQPLTKRPRGRPRLAGRSPLPIAAQSVPRCGAALLQRISAISEDMCTRWEVGTQLLAKVRGWKCHWPVVVWSARLCLRKDMAQLLESHKQERMLVRFYGERSMMWVREEDMQEGSLDDGHVAEMQDWERLHRRPGLVQSVLEELEGACAEPVAEVTRLQHLQRVHSFSPSPSCTLCLEEGAELHCTQCQRALHTLCLQQPCLAPSDLPEGAWACPCCGQSNSCLGDEAEVDTEEKVERMGLTPDWIIQAAAFVVFRLPRPTPAQPYIAGLLDPCTNSMIAPNIPAEVLYDKKMNGLLMSNSWAGYHILLNPDYSAAIQWRFVNRAIDEVENGRVPAVLLVCRNSTDTAYFQRLRPYPRVMLRRNNCSFKDYDKTPIGFGVAVFCIAKAPCKELHERFFDGFAAMGEPNIPIDKALMQSAAFLELLGRLKRHSEEHQRDHWIQCSLCVQWRIITYDTLLQVRSDASWTCAQLRPPFSSCRTPSSKRELAGSRGYATIDSSGQASEDSAAEVPLDVSGCAAPSVHENPAEEHAIPPGLAAEQAGLGKAPSETAKTCLSTDSEAGGVSSGGSCAGSAAAGRLACCNTEAQGGSSCSARSAGICADDTVGRESGAHKNGQAGPAVAPAVQKGSDCTSGAALQHSEQEANNPSTHVCQAPVHQAHTAEGSDHQHLEITAQPTQQPVMIAGCEAEPASEDIVCSAGAEAASASAEAPELTATAASGSAGGNSGCESAATCAAAPAWAWATVAPAAASADPHPWRSGSHDAVPHAPQADLQTARRFLQAAMQLLPPSHALPSRGLETVDDGEDCQQLSAIELARNARIAANRAYMASVIAFPSCNSNPAAGESLPVDHPLVLTAARELAKKAALKQARQQVEAAERQWETGQRVRRMKAAELKSQLAALEEQQVRAAELLRASKATSLQLEEEYRRKATC